MSRMVGEILEKISYHAVYDDSIPDALAYARGNGFSGVQVALDVPHLSFEDLSGQQCKAIKRFVDGEGMRLVLHGPDHAASLFESSQYLSEGIFKYFEAMFSFAERAGARMITLHLGVMPAFSTDPLTTGLEKVYLSILNENLRCLVDLADERFVLCFENFGSFESVMDVLQQYLDAGRVWLCWDLAKGYGRERIEAFFWKNVDHVRQVHLHDISLDGSRSHRVIGTGIVDFMHFLPRVSSADVIDYCIEVRPRESATESLMNLKAMIEDDPRAR